MGSNLIFGKRGEDAACVFLQKKGYIIIERNFRIRNGEIDIIALDKTTKSETLVFVEVKTRESNAFGTPLEAINYYKLKFLIRTATFYSMTHPKLPQSLRIDAISVLLGAREELYEIEHIKNISQ